MSFLRNGWYVAAMSEEIGRSLLARRILDEPLIMYRTENGTAVVLEDFCPHRLLPLSKGCLVGDLVQCAYHGLQFDASGKCVKIPGQKNVPGKVRVRRYPVVEKHQWLYIWMGEADRADPALIPEYAEPKSDPAWHHFAGRFPANCNYLLVLDNLMDLSHLAYVHGTSVGTPDIAERATVETTTRGDRVRVCRTTCDIAAASAYANFGKYDGNIHRWQVTEYSPPTFFLVNNGSKPASEAVPTEDDTRGQGNWGFQVYHAITPETETTTHDFWSIAFPSHLLPEEGRPAFKNTILAILEEDRTIYDAQQPAVEKKSENGRIGFVQSRIALQGDKALFAARRVLRTKINAESAAAVAAAAAE